MQQREETVVVEMAGAKRNMSSLFGGSEYSIGSEDRLSIREVNLLRKWCVEKEKEERRNNIVIKRAKPTGDLKVWTQRFLKESLEIECKMYTAD